MPNMAEQGTVKWFNDAKGWRYLIDRTSLKAGTDPAEGTRHRQAELDDRESKALKENGDSHLPSRNPER